MICNTDLSSSCWGFGRGEFKGIIIKVNVRYLIYISSCPSFRDCYNVKIQIVVLSKYSRSSKFLLREHVLI